MASLPLPYAVIYHPNRDGTWSAELADVPTIKVTGADIDDVRMKVARAAKDYFDGLRDNGRSVPNNLAVAGYVHPDKLKRRPARAKRKRHTPVAGNLFHE